MNMDSEEFHGELPQSDLFFEAVLKPSEEKICCKIFTFFLFLSKDVYYGKKRNNLVKD